MEVPRHLNDKRFDSVLSVLLQERYPEISLSRGFATRAIKEGKALLNGVSAKPSVIVATHDMLSVEQGLFVEQSLPRAVSSETLPIQVLFEDERILVLDKGAGVQVHQGGARSRITVADWIFANYPKLALVGEDPLRPGIVHRLDRDTSGILVLAKDNESFQALKKAFQNREIEKTYVALVYGNMEALEGEISASLMRQKGALKRKAIDPERYHGPLTGTLRSALTRYRVLSRSPLYDLLLVTPKTGRTHQIRVHLSFLGHPVVGDRLYAFKDVKRQKLLFPSRHMLHAAGLSFSLFGRKYHFRSPLPQDFRETLQGVDETAISSYDDEALKSLF